MFYNFWNCRTMFYCRTVNSLVTIFMYIRTEMCIRDSYYPTTHYSGLVYTTYLISSIVALFIGSICSIWHNRLTTVLFKYSGIGKTPAVNRTQHTYLCEHRGNPKNRKPKSTSLITKTCSYTLLNPFNIILYHPCY